MLRCRRAAHFATFRAEDDEENAEDNVHVGGDEVRLLGIRIFHVNVHLLTTRNTIWTWCALDPRLTCVKTS